MSKEKLESIAKTDALRNRRLLIDKIKGSQSVAIGTFCIEDLTIFPEIESKFLYIITASNDHSAKKKINSSPDSKDKLLSNLNIRDTVAHDHAMVRALPNHHAKYWLSGLSDDEEPSGIFFSGDLTSSSLGLNSPNGNSHELLLNLNTQESKELRLFVKWVMATRPAFDILPSRSLKLTGNLPLLPNFNQLLITKPNHTIKKSISLLIDSSKKSIDVTSWAISSDNDIFHKLLSVCDKKHVRIISHTAEVNLEALKLLRDAGAEVKFCSNMHAKVWIADIETNSRAIITSSNILNDGMNEGFEIGITLTAGDVRLNSVIEFFRTRYQLSRDMGGDNVIEKSKKSVDSLKSIDQVVKFSPRLEIF